MIKQSEQRYVAAINRLKARKPTLVEGDYDINLDTIAAECGLKRGSIRKDRLSYEFKLLLKIETDEHSKQLDEEPASKLKMANDECKKLRAEINQLRSELGKSIAREMNLAFELMSTKKPNVHMLNAK
jgi:hypothetical protein